MNRIKYLREKADLLQEELAQKVGTSQKNISNYETEKRSVPDEIKIKLCEVFNCDMEYLMGFSDFNNKDVDISKVQFANHSGLNTEGLTDRDIEELKAQIEFKRKYNKEKKEGK